MTRDPQERDDVEAGWKSRPESRDFLQYRLGGVPILNGRQAGEKSVMIEMAAGRGRGRT